MSRTSFRGTFSKIRKDRLHLLIIVNFFLLYGRERESRSKRDPISNVGVVVVKPVEKGETGREQWRDPSSKKYNSLLISCVSRLI